MSFFCRRSDPYGSRHNTESSISDPNGSLALLRRRIYDISGSVGKLWGWICDLNGSGIQILGIRSRDPFSGSMGMSAIDDTLLLVAVVLAIKRTVPPRKSCQLYQNSIPKCWGRSTEHVCNSSSKNIPYFATYWGLKYLGLWHHLRCAFYSTVLVLRQTIYGGRLLLVIALVIALC